MTDAPEKRDSVLPEIQTGDDNSNLAAPPLHLHH